MAHLQELAAVQRRSDQTEEIDEVRQDLITNPKTAINGDNNKNDVQSEKEDSDSTDILFLAPGQNQREREHLAHIIAQERGHLQWKKQGINFIIFILLCLLNVSKGSKDQEPSSFTIEACSSADWIAKAIYCLVCLLISNYSIKVL